MSDHDPNSAEALQIGFRPRCMQGLVAGSFSALSWMGKFLPVARPQRHGVERVQDVAYSDTGQPTHTLDVYCPVEQTGLRPVVLYIHGGGFQHMSKDSHWLMGLAFARRGYVVFSIDYRLAPEHPFPAGIQDVVTAFDWVANNATEWGGDPSRIVVAGESAGANLAAALTVAHCFEPVADWARPVCEAKDARIVAALPACGVFQVDQMDRLYDHPRAFFFVRDILSTIEATYLRNGLDPALAPLANPVNFLESDAQPIRPLPPFCIPVGGGDVLSQDHARLAAALTTRGVPMEAKVYGKEPHAFHAMVWRKLARTCWADQFDFLETHGVGPDAR